MPGVHGPQCGCVHEKELPGAQFLLSFINKDGIRGLNESTPGSAKTIFKEYDERLDESKFCRSEEGDPELIIHIPFSSPCKISGLHVIGGEEGRFPASVKIFADREDLDFTTVGDTECIQEVQLKEDFHGSLEYPLKDFEEKAPTTREKLFLRFMKPVQTQQTIAAQSLPIDRLRQWKKDIDAFVHEGKKMRNSVNSRNCQLDLIPVVVTTAERCKRKR